MRRKYYNIDGDLELKRKPAFLAKVDKWKVFKQVVGAAASGCATVVMHKYLKASLPEAENMFDKAVMAAGTYFITGVVGAKVTKYVEQELDEWHDSITQVKGSVVEEDADGGDEA